LGHIGKISSQIISGVAPITDKDEAHGSSVFQDSFISTRIILFHFTLFEKLARHAS
jgi:hypothetical protein